jgi:DNA repair and recombination protein RAD54B
MGSTTWKGDNLHSGYKTIISGKEVELDREVSASQLPDAIVNTNEDEESPDISSEPGLHPQASQTVQDDELAKLPGPSNIGASSSRFVAPASFYGTAPKPKPGEPL